MEAYTVYVLIIIQIILANPSGHPIGDSLIARPNETTSNPPQNHRHNSK